MQETDMTQIHQLNIQAIRLNKNNKNVDSSFLNKLKDLENVKIFTEIDNRISNK
jgi:hypothetical protein